jgi:membrane protein implicated in regulation of membrane protease activity
MHVAIAMLNALFIREILGRLAAFLAWSYLAFILFGSVYLGWHYAVDGYASIVLVAIIYWAGRRISRYLSARDQR